MNANVPSPAPAPAPKKSNSSTIIIVVVIVALCLCCVLGGTLYYLYQNGDQIFKTGPIPIVDLENVVPAVCMKCFHKAVVFLQHHAHKRHVGAVEERFQHDCIRLPTQDFPGIFPCDLACQVSLEDPNALPHPRH